MDKKYFNIIDSKPTQDLIELMDLVQGRNYDKKETKNRIPYFRIKLDSSSAKLMYDLLKDVDIYIPRFKAYLSDFIFLRLKVTPAIVRLINEFDVDQLFSPFLHIAKIAKFKDKYPDFLNKKV